jgi:hypothetical protein
MQLWWTLADAAARRPYQGGFLPAHEIDSSPALSVVCFDKLTLTAICPFVVVGLLFIANQSATVALEWKMRGAKSRKELRRRKRGSKRPKHSNILCVSLLRCAP